MRDVEHKPKALIILKYAYGMTKHQENDDKHLNNKSFDNSGL